MKRIIAIGKRPAKSKTTTIRQPLARCLICGEILDGKKPVKLAIIDGTQKGNLCEVLPYHDDCVRLRYRINVKVLYQAVK